jgi:lipoprotein-anchoring transpeptidase ErfK/SrfK
MTLRAEGETPDVRGYGIHGTWDNSAIGKAESQGCVRMRNEDVEELFALLPLKTAVVITE